MVNMRIKQSQLLTMAVISLAVGLLSGCVSAHPEPSSPALVVSAVTPDEARQSEAIGSVVRWGGTIASVSNSADGMSVLEIVSRPLYSGGRPIHNDRSAGRFVAETSDFLDPEIIEVGRDFTLVGTVSAVRDGKVGEADYRFPVVAIDTYRYWKPRATPPSRSKYRLHGYGPHGYDPFWDDWPFPSKRRRSGASGSLSIILR